MKRVINFFKQFKCNSKETKKELLDYKKRYNDILTYVNEKEYLWKENDKKVIELSKTVSTLDKKCIHLYEENNKSAEHVEKRLLEIKNNKTEIRSLKREIKLSNELLNEYRLNNGRKKKGRL